MKITSLSLLMQRFGKLNSQSVVSHTDAVCATTTTTTKNSVTDTRLRLSTGQQLTLVLIPAQTKAEGSLLRHIEEFKSKCRINWLSWYCFPRCLKCVFNMLFSATYCNVKEIVIIVGDMNTHWLYLWTHCYSVAMMRSTTGSCYSKVHFLI